MTYAGFAGRGNRVGKIIGARCFVKKVGWTADAERGVLGEWLPDLESGGIKRLGEAIACLSKN